MSDYLWDKSGEADATVDRLEKLLAERRHEPEPLRLPPAISPPAPRVRNPRYAYPQVAALAAAVVLAILVGVWALTTDEREGRENVSVAANDVRQKAPGGESARPPAPVVTAPPVESTAGPEGEGARRRARQAPAAARREARTIKRAAGEPPAVARAGRTSRGASPEGGGLTAGGAEADSPALVERRLAKEQLMLAMRVTSAKLNVARNMTQTP